ncbi:MAG TPA: nuclear transport factor 2 family protein [Cyclobacteriaceae bacterium]|nr:nuclear transport factor 2 family protein [Cyclobacteriaceae bacterium]
MENPKDTIERFYSAFQKKDWKTMQECYHPEVQFSDPVFTALKGNSAKAMWHMLILAGKDLELTFSNVHANGNTGSCDWEAFYSFSRTGRKVHNVIQAAFEFRDGKIIRHTDSFDLWKWAGMALGTSGKLLGWSPLIRLKVIDTAARNLTRFISDHPEYKN